jgi:hypothetical protein
LPNQLTLAYSPSQLLTSYALFARELNRLPSSGDIRLKDHNDQSLPHATTFENHFGSKAELLKQLRDFCTSHEQFKDVLGLCNIHVVRTSRKTPDTNSVGPEIGFVYLTKAGRFFKIGKTNAAGRREREIALQLPEKSSTVHVMRTDDPHGIEAYWHSRFASKRKNGEWFQLSAEDVAAFKRRKFM